eukprot:scaffold10163_cov35-Tisochrysis_lutea.AAC.5
MAKGRMLCWVLPEAKGQMLCWVPPEALIRRRCRLAYRVLQRVLLPAAPYPPLMPRGQTAGKREASIVSAFGYE